MQYAIDIPNFGSYGDARTVAELAREAEASGWDGLFIWDHVMYFTSQPIPVVDPWTALTAAAMVTDRIRLGPLVTPLARRRPWMVARQAASLDHLSGGRVALGVGLGEPAAREFGLFGEDADPRVRAARLDESLDIIDGLWSGEEFSYEGEHFTIGPVRFTPAPAQQPRIPIWVGGAWPNRRPFRRAARWDGVVPMKAQSGSAFEMISPDEVRTSTEYVRSQRTVDDPFEVVVGAESPLPDRGRAAEYVGRFADAGATWWMEALTDFRGPIDEMRAIIRGGPPKR